MLAGVCAEYACRGLCGIKHIPQGEFSVAYIYATLPSLIGVVDTSTQGGEGENLHKNVGGREAPTPPSLRSFFLCSGLPGPTRVNAGARALEAQKLLNKIVISVFFFLHNGREL
jgi:hypothetical protein